MIVGVDGNFFLQADEEDQEMVVEGDDAEVPAPGADPEVPCQTAAYSSRRFRVFESCYLAVNF